MRELSTQIISKAAEAAGLPTGRVIDISKADNLTIPRPRIELQWLPESYARTGRKLGHLPGPEKGKRLLKKEVYTAKLQVSANLLAEDAAWLAAFAPAFVGAFPRGVNDAAGNWVSIQVERAEWLNTPAPRVGLEKIQVFTKLAQLFVIGFSWRLTAEQEQQLIERVEFKHKPSNRGSGNG